jgi:hypothetical protein
LHYSSIRRAGETIERGERGGEFELELRRVDALGLGDEKAPAQQLEIEAQPLVRLA